MDRIVSLFVVCLLLASCATAPSRIESQKDEFTGKQEKRLLILMAPSYSEVFNLDFTRTEGDSTAKLTVSVNSGYFSFSTGKSLRVKSGDKTFEFSTKLGASENLIDEKYVRAVTIEFEPIPLTLLKEISKSNVVKAQAIGKDQKVTGSFSDKDIGLLRQFVN